MKKLTVLNFLLLVSAVVYAADKPNRTSLQPSQTHAPQNDSDGLPEHKTAPAKYCLSYADFKADNWIDVDSLEFHKRTASQKAWAGGTDFNFKTADKELMKTIKKKAFAVVFDDSLFVNSHGLKHKGQAFGNGYVKGYRLSGGRIVFLYSYVSMGKSIGLGVSAGIGVGFGAIGGLIGGMMVGMTMNSDWVGKVCYLIESDARKVTCIDQEVLPQLLQGHDDLIEEYNRIEGRKEKREAAVVMPMLIRAGLIE